MVRVLLTGGAGDLGTVLTPLLEQRGDVPWRLDIVPPGDGRGVYVAGSILDRSRLAHALKAVDCIVHIAAWHGIHETSGRKDAYDFWDLNVTGTFNVFEAAVRAGVKRIAFISSTSIRHRSSLYGHTKVLAEEIAHTYAVRHAMQVVTLRPRGFIPHWNRATYTSFVDWAQWFWRGAVHIDDVAQAVLKSLDLLATTTLESDLVLVVDGAYDYTDEDLRQWDQGGPGSTFRTYYPQYYDLAVRYGLDPAAKPHKLDITPTRQWLDYVPRYSLRNLLEELDRYGPAGPPTCQTGSAREEAHHSMPSIKVDVFGRKMLVVQSENGWSVFYLGDEGKRRPATDIVVPRQVAAADVVQYLADLCHEWASARHPQVKRLG